MNLPIYQIDAFTSELFHGNPAAVVLLDEWLDDATLQSIAAENNLAETAFVIPRSDVSLLRWFTPTIEVDLCGHATLAAAHVLFTEKFRDSKNLNFETRSGILSVRRAANLLSLDFPSRPGKPIPIPDALVTALGARPSETFLARDLLAIFDDESIIRTMRPDFAKLAALDYFAVIISAPGADVDFVSRFFAPRAGIPEDPVTGSAHCTLTPYWSARLGKQKLTAKQLSPRGGYLECELQADRVIISGQTIEYLRGEITISE